MKALIFVFSSVALLGLALAQGRADVPFQVIDRGTQSGEAEQGVKVLRTERAFEEFMKGNRAEDKISKLTKQVDWNTEQVLVVFGGQQPTGGFGIDVKRISSVDIQRLVVEARLIKPGPNQLVTQALTTPYVMIKTQRQVAAIKVKFLPE
ncbi:MAG: protease complex subunit PrcB family protein [Chlorobia bacterium]|nr:protease complex subunit PrcB family protein [Fimbriimonadaceae bacterium]